MVEFALLGDEDKIRVAGLATSWYREHIHHVVKLVRKQSVAYSPSGSDLFRPELWKAAHWKWFTDVYILKAVKEIK